MFLPLPILIWLVSRYAIPVPWADEFNLVPLIHEMNAHTLTFADLMAQHNEHRPFFPQGLMLAMAAISHWNISWEIAANVVLALLSLALLVRLVWQTFPDRALLRWTLAVAFSWIILSPSQYENWLWGWEIEWFLAVLGVLVTATALSGPGPVSKSRLGIAAVAAAVADYSLASGVLAWVGGLIILFCRGERRALKWTWTAIAVLIAAPYYYHYHSSTPSHGSLAFTVEHLGAFLRYFFVYLGDPLSTSPRGLLPGLVAGLAGVCLALAFVGSCCYIGLRYRAALGRLAPWLAVGTFAAGSAALTGVGRLELGTAEALSSRYVSVSLLFLLATIVVTLIALEDLAPQRPRLFGVATAVSASLIGILVVAGYAGGIVHARQFPGVADYSRCAHAARSPNVECLRLAYPPSSQYAFEQIQYLRKIHWDGF
jgi:hypothetical protein